MLRNARLAASSRRIDETGDGPPLVEIELRDVRSNRTGLLLFGMLDRTGSPVPPRRRGEVDELADRALNRVRNFAFGRREAAQLTEGATFKFSISSRPIMLRRNRNGPLRDSPCVMLL